MAVIWNVVQWQSTANTYGWDPCTGCQLSRGCRFESCRSDEADFIIVLFYGSKEWDWQRESATKKEVIK